MSDTKCALMDHQMMVDFTGRISPCCHINFDASIDDYDEKIRPYREALSQGNRIDMCKTCWRDEESGLESLRQSSNKSAAGADDVHGYRNIDLRTDTNCNMGCTMCSDMVSSLWHKLTGDGKHQALSSSHKEKLLTLFKNDMQLSVQGGEPFYGKSTIEFIDAVPNKSQVTLEVFTNLITAKEEILKRWIKEFKHVMIIASIDGTDEVYEQIRWPASFKKLEKKFDAIYPMVENSININFTVQNINVSNIPDFIAWRNTRYPRASITFSVLDNPRPLRVTNLYPEEKLDVLERLSNIKGLFPRERLRLTEIVNLISDSSTTEEWLNARERYLSWVEKLRQKSPTKFEE